MLSFVQLPEINFLPWVIDVPLTTGQPASELSFNNFGDLTLLSNNESTEMT